MENKMIYCFNVNGFLVLFEMVKEWNIKKQAGAELDQPQLKLELELCFTSFEICLIKLS